MIVVTQYEGFDLLNLPNPDPSLKKDGNPRRPITAGCKKIRNIVKHGELARDFYDDTLVDAVLSHPAEAAEFLAAYDKPKEPKPAKGSKGTPKAKETPAKASEAPSGASARFVPTIAPAATVAPALAPPVSLPPAGTFTVAERLAALKAKLQARATV
jgi:hypothetical protein